MARPIKELLSSMVRMLVALRPECENVVVFRLRSVRALMRTTNWSWVCYDVVKKEENGYILVN